MFHIIFVSWQARFTFTKFSVRPSTTTAKAANETTKLDFSPSLIPSHVTVHYIVIHTYYTNIDLTGFQGLKLTQSQIHFPGAPTSDYLIQTKSFRLCCVFV